MRNAVERAHDYRQFERYGAALDAGLPQKVAVLAPWLRTWAAGDIVDIGSGTGALAARHADLYRASSVIGVDAVTQMVSLARTRYGGRRNLEFRFGDASQVHSERAASVVFSSVLHEVYSYHGDSLGAVSQALAAAWQSLLPGGRMIIRDFVAPDNARRPVLLCHDRADVVPAHDFVSFSRRFLRPVCVQGVQATPRTMIYETDLGSACEYVLRKDYHAMWDVELQERYGFWTAADAHRLTCAAGFEIVHSAGLHNRWLSLSSWKGKVELRDPDSLEALSFPPPQLLLVAEKPACRH
jgi:SAM-dependent methyltransferase